MRALEATPPGCGQGRQAAREDPHVGALLEPKYLQPSLGPAHMGATGRPRRTGSGVWRSGGRMASGMRKHPHPTSPPPHAGALQQDFLVKRLALRSGYPIPRMCIRADGDLRTADGGAPPSALRDRPCTWSSRARRIPALPGRGPAPESRRRPRARWQAFFPRLVTEVSRQPAPRPSPHPRARLSVVNPAQSSLPQPGELALSALSPVPSPPSPCPA